MASPVSLLVAVSEVAGAEVEVSADESLVADVLDELLALDAGLLLVLASSDEDPHPARATAAMDKVSAIREVVIFQ